jgi:hypothetical protein
MKVSSYKGTLVLLAICALVGWAHAQEPAERPAVHDFGVDAVTESDASNGGASLAAFANDLEFELWTAIP